MLGLLVLLSLPLAVVDYVPSLHGIGMAPDCTIFMLIGTQVNS